MTNEVAAICNNFRPGGFARSVDGINPPVVCDAVLEVACIRVCANIAHIAAELQGFNVVRVVHSTN